METMDLCISCEEFGLSIEILDCGHTFCDNCQQEKDAHENGRCPICQEVSKCIEDVSVSKDMLTEILAFRPLVLVNSPTKEEIKSRYRELRDSLENAIVPPSDLQDDQDDEDEFAYLEKFPRLPLKTKDESIGILDDWYRSALKVYELNEQTIAIYNEKANCILKLIKIRMDLVPKIWILIQNLQRIQLIPNPLPRAFWLGRLNFASDRDYNRLTLKQQMAKSKWEMIHAISPDGHFLKCGPNHLIFKDRKIETNVYFGTTTRDKIFFKSWEHDLIKVMNHDLVHLEDIQITGRFFSMCGYEDDLYTFSSNPPQIHRINSELELVESKPLNKLYKNDSCQMIVGRSRIYLFAEKRMSVLDRESMEIMANYRCAYSGEGAFFAYDHVNDLVCGLDMVTCWLRIFDIDLRMICEIQLHNLEIHSMYFGPVGELYLVSLDSIWVY